MKYLPVILVKLMLLQSCKKEDVYRNVKLTAFCKVCAVEYYDGNGRMHRDTMYGNLMYTWMGGEAIVDTLPDWTAGWNIVLEEKDQPRISACSLHQDSAILMLKAEGQIPTRTITAHGGCAHMP